MIDYSKQPIFETNQLHQIRNLINKDDEFIEDQIKTYPNYENYWLAQKKSNIELRKTLDDYETFWNSVVE